jgi:LacI family transcriptional regulator
MPSISEETRKRVHLAAQQAGYRPNRAGVRLRTGKTNVITVVLNAEHDATGSGFFSDFLYGVSDGLKESQYHLVVTPYSLHDPMEPIRYIIETGSADGVIFSRTEPEDARVRYLVENKMPFATHGRTATDIEHPFHDFDNEAFAFEAVRHLRDSGRSRLMLLAPPRGLTYYVHTNAGFEHGIAAFGGSVIPFSSMDIDSPLAALRAAAKAIAMQDGRPNGIVASSMSSSLAFAAGFKDAGLEIGKDFDVVTKHTTELIKLMHPGIISIPEDFRLAGFELAQMLIASIRGAPARSLQRIVGPGTAE